MTPILGIMASQISGHLYTYAPTGSMFHIASTTLSTATTSITFSSIAADYTHLQIRGINLASVTNENVRIQFNSDTGSNYSYHYLYGNGSSAGASGTASTAYSLIGLNGSTSAAGAYVVDVLDYANTNKYKTTRSLTGNDQNGSGYAMLISGNWRSTSAISTITISPLSGTFNTYTSFALYGVK